MNAIHEANRKQWNVGAERWKERTDKRGFWNKCHKEPSLVLTDSELEYLKGIQGKTVCVLGSGDNEVVFALAGMGAEVTSVDIAERQLEIASDRADSLGLKISFLRADVTHLDKIENDSYDTVYTGGHVSVWTSDINNYYSEAVRILKAGSIFIINEYHPFRRIWCEDSNELVLKYPYFNRGPFEFRTRDELPQFEYHWTVADHIQTMISTGCELLMIEEHGEEGDDWNKTNLKQLPQNLLLVGKKNATE